MRLKEEMRVNLELKDLEIQTVQTRGLSETEELRRKVCDLNSQMAECKKESDSALTELKNMKEADSTVCYVFNALYRRLLMVGQWMRILWSIPILLIR
jgi:hypothetical protein